MQALPEVMLWKVISHLGNWMPEVMQAARADIDQALDIARTVDEYRRVKLIDESFTLFELEMAAQSYPGI